MDISEAEYLYIQASRITSAGRGLFTAIDFYKGEIVSIFKGEVLSVRETLQRITAGQDQYFIVQLDGQILDSKHVDCFAKYANDAKGLAESNFKNNTKITLDEDNNVCLEAMRTIKAGEEIFCGYGKPYWEKHG